MILKDLYEESKIIISTPLPFLKLLLAEIPSLIQTCKDRQLITAADKWDSKGVEHKLSQSKVNKNILNVALYTACNFEYYLVWPPFERKPTDDLYDVVTCLIKHGADINSTVKDITPLGYSLTIKNISEFLVRPFMRHLLENGASPFISCNVGVKNRVWGYSYPFKLPVKEAMNYLRKYRLLDIIIQEQEEKIILLITNQICLLKLFPQVLCQLIAEYDAPEIKDPRKDTSDQQDFEVFKHAYTQYTATWSALFGFNRMSSLLKEEKIQSMREVKDYISKNPTDKNIKKFVEFKFIWQGDDNYSFFNSIAPKSRPSKGKPLKVCHDSHSL